MSETLTCNVFNAHPSAAVASESPLVWSYAQTGVPKVANNSGITLRERSDFAHLTLRGAAIELDKALREVLQLSLPSQPLSLTQIGEYSAQWMSPDEWLLIVPQGEEFAIEQQLRAAMGAAHYAIVSVGGGQMLLELSGEQAINVLKKSVVYDVHPKNFPPGKGVMTCFATVTVILRRPTQDRWELVVRRSFADYSYRWLLDAGAEYGITVLV
ncbi:sarcosine oxidase subunit gamma [Pantoea rodasii]|uniref:Sarcosine oxidase subunit gamma n=1 Tax=Pantoea rodasii TaxID=1076549 RepID=A0A2M9W717_9GAMM|nr:sarcosine oxidase subunit gamma family protein [Pantoea rodasii]ORM65421.1 sarcosine oxidase subunit gamma [Pantoea rodasii]PJZ03337.1 sarcosine oxidase subunit gamma [Pantoea rodasii]